jgi:hypothetical protein
VVAGRDEDSGPGNVWCRADERHQILVGLANRMGKEADGRRITRYAAEMLDNGGGLFLERVL